MSILAIKIPAVEAVWQKPKFFFFLLFLILNPQAWALDKELPSCKLLSRGPGVDLTQKDVRLHGFLLEFMQLLGKESVGKVESLFHPKAKNTKDLGQKIEAILKNRYQSPWSFSVYRVWHIQIPNASKAILKDCPDSEGANIIAQYGYKEQFAIWLQVMGQNELGRIMIAVAPLKEKLVVTAIRVQQWTQEEKDWQAWAQKADLLAKEGKTIKAYLALDVAQKLLESDDLLFYEQSKTLKEEKDRFGNRNQLVQTLNQELKIDSIKYVGSLLAKEGTGILIREELAEQKNKDELYKHCQTRAEALLKLQWLALPTLAFRCNFIPRGAPADQDSPLGGFFLTAEDLEKAKK